MDLAILKLTFITIVVLFWRLAYKTKQISGSQQYLKHTSLRLRREEVNVHAFLFVDQ